MSETGGKGLLDGIRVLDFGRYIAGPYCAALLGDLGAEVIRVEKRDGSEDRYVQPIVPGAAAGEGGEGAMFLQMNRNKKGLTLDPMTDEGREVVRKLVRTADVVVANLPPATLKAMGLDYESLKAEKSDIILTTVSAFGHGGPYSERTGFDGVAQSMVGAAYLTGHPDEPMKSYAPWVDFGTASLTALGTLAALMHRAKTGEGQIVEGALIATAMAYFNFHLIEQDLRQVNRIAIGNRSPYAAPVDYFRAKDGWLLVQVLGEPLFRRFARLIDAPDLLEDPRFKDDSARGEHGEILSERMQAWCESRTVAEALDELEKARIPAGPVLTPQQILDDPHIAAMNYLKSQAFPGMDKPAPIMETPVRLSGCAPSIRERAPQLGEHTDALLGELGYDAAGIGTLREKGVI